MISLLGTNLERFLIPTNLNRSKPGVGAFFTAGDAELGDYDDEPAVAGAFRGAVSSRRLAAATVP